MKSRLEVWIFIVITVLFMMYLVETTSMKDVAIQDNRMIIVKSSDNDTYMESSNAYYDRGRNTYIDINIVRSLSDKLIYDSKYNMAILTTYDKVLRYKEDGVYENNIRTTKYPRLVKNNRKVYIEVTSIAGLLNLEVDKSSKGRLIVRGKERPLTIGITTSKYSVRLKDKKSCFASITHILKGGTQVQILAQDNSWIHIMLKDGTFGYIKKVDIETYDRIDGIVEAAKEPIWQSEEKIIMSWEYDGKGKLNPYKIKGLKGLDVTSPTWISIVNGDGKVVSHINKEYIKWAKNKGYKIWPLVNNSFKPSITHEFLNDMKTREQIINELLSIVRKNELDGINIDFENINVEDKENLVQFIRELTPLFNKYDLVVSMDVTIIGGSNNWSKCYDRVALGKVVDYMAIMTYDEHWASSPKAGSVASVDWMEKSIIRMKTQVPEEKILMGIPFYTRVWTETEDSSGNIKLSSKAVSMNYVNNLIKKHSLKKTWLNDDGQYYIEYRKDNNRYRVWVEDKESIEQKARLVDKLNIRGVATWRRGFETSDVWTVLESEIR